MHQPPSCGMLSGERLTLLVTQRGALMRQKLANYIDFPLRQRMFMWYCLRFKRGYAFVSNQNTQTHTHTNTHTHTHTLSSWNPRAVPLQQYSILLNLTFTGVPVNHKFCSLNNKYQILDDQRLDSGQERETAHLQNALNCLWGPPNLFLGGYRGGGGIFHRGQIGRRVNRTSLSFHKVLLSSYFCFCSTLEAVRNTEQIPRVCEPRRAKSAHTWLFWSPWKILKIRNK
jgi:hypothetical protein